MKECAYCGRESADEADRCRECGTAFGVKPMLGVATAVGNPPPPTVPRLLDPVRIEGAYNFVDGFFHPVWQQLRQVVASTVEREDYDRAWNEIALDWVDHLRKNLGGSYRVTESASHILLSEQEPSAAVSLLAFADGVLAYLREQLGEAVRQEEWGRGVILLFTDADDYYQYVSHFDRDGVHPASGGCLIARGYLHVAAPVTDAQTTRSMLAHEMTHGRLAHLPIPLWLNEGCATAVEHQLVPSRRPVLDRELRDRHLAFWSEERIQEFWAATTFQQPGEPFELSYSLAEILVTLMSKKPEPFNAFLQAARFDDAGQTAALDWLGTSLGDLVAGFLGPGDWRPYRHKMVECWRQAGWKVQGTAAREDRAEPGGTMLDCPAGAGCGAGLLRPDFMLPAPAAPDRPGRSQPPHCHENRLSRCNRSRDSVDTPPRVRR